MKKKEKILPTGPVLKLASVNSEGRIGGRMIDVSFISKMLKMRMTFMKSES